MALVLVLTAGGTLATAAIARSVQADRRARQARTGLSATEDQLNSLRECSDTAVRRLSASRHPVDLAVMSRLMDRLRKSWRIVEGTAPEGHRAWLLRASGVATGQWTDFVGDLSAIERVDGMRIEAFSARIVDDGRGPATLSIEAQLLAAVSMDREVRQ